MGVDGSQGGRTSASSKGRGARARPQRRVTGSAARRERGPGATSTQGGARFGSSRTMAAATTAGAPPLQGPSRRSVVAGRRPGCARWRLALWLALVARYSQLSRPHSNRNDAPGVFQTRQLHARRAAAAGRRAGTSAARGAAAGARARNETAAGRCCVALGSARGSSVSLGEAGRARQSRSRRARPSRGRRLRLGEGWGGRDGWPFAWRRRQWASAASWQKTST